MARRRTRWADLSAGRRAAVVVAGGTELALTATALRLLLTTPRANLRGPRAAWFAALAVQPFGPIAALTLARRR